MTATTTDQPPVTATGPAGPGWPDAVAFTANGVSLVLGLPTDTLPVIAHWGADLNLLDADARELARHAQAPHAANGVDVPRPVTVIPEGSRGWIGTPGLSGHRAGAAWSSRMRPRAVDVHRESDGTGRVLVLADDRDADLELRLTLQLLPSGLVRLECTLTNLGDSPYQVESLSMALPVPARAEQVHDLAGRWTNERVPQSQPFTVGVHARDSRRGRPGADSTLLLTAGTADLDFGAGEAWSMHVAFSGNHQHRAERVATGERLLAAGELLLPGEVELAPGESYCTPPVLAAYGQGLDGVAARFHDHLRARGTHPRSRRPVVMNVWEAVYFDHDLDRISALADLAAQIGVERFVLDDGWFGARRDATAGLGDWVVADDIWGGGRLAELVTRVKGLGMEFGLWFEPEMVNLDSDLARAHPEWILQVPGRLPPEARHQLVLDLTHPGAFGHVRDQIAALVREYGIDYLKWDHNRDLVDAGSTRTGRAGVHEQTLAVYRLLDEIRAACPGLEIESCASGGARIDLGILERTDRVWASDCIDARERQQIQRWTAQLLPPELVGSHVGSGNDHQTGRRLDLPFRAATALFGHFGIEWDLTAASDADRVELARWVAFHKEQRSLIHSGRTVRRSLEGGAVWLHGAVAADQSRALFAVNLRERPSTWPLDRVPLPGLAPGRHYRVRAVGPDAEAPFNPQVHPSWWVSGTTLRGDALGEVGVHVPALRPDQTVLLEAVAR